MKTAIYFAILFVAAASVYCPAQQKAQWVPGQYGLNAGIVPEPGFTYQNLAVNYSANQLNDSDGKALPNVAGNYSFWLDENIFMYVPKKKILGGYFAPYGMVSVASGSLVADFGSLFGGSGGGSGLSDTFASPANIGWHFKRADISAGYAFTAPTGRFAPGASNNIGSGYWGHSLVSGSTVYLTKNKGTSADLLMVWEFDHGTKSGTNIKPGQAVTMEWGFGQALPLDKDLHKLLQLGFVGYDQWQVTNNQGPTALLPYYSSHGIGVQGNFILPKPGLALFFKYYSDVSAKATTQGRSFVFGGSWTLKHEK